MQSESAPGHISHGLVPRDVASNANHLLDALVSRATAPTVIADASDPALAVVAANDQARPVTEDIRPSMALVDWIGPPSVEALRGGLARHESAGIAGEWRWTLTSMGSRQFLLVEGPESTMSLDAPFTDRDRLVAVHEAIHAVNSDIDLESVLQRIVDVAREVVPARYAALGVADERGRITQFITSGLTDEQRAAIGQLPEGHGLLGTLIREGHPLLVSNINADERSFGFPPHHPPMRTLLGVPIALNGAVLGDLYLTDRVNGEAFTDQDVETVGFLAAHAARAIERARLYEAIRREHQHARAQRDQLQAVLDNLPSAVIIVAPPDGRVELANRAAYRLIRGSDPSPDNNIQQVTDFGLFRPDGLLLPDADRPSIRALGGLPVGNQQLLVEGWDGRRIPVLMQATPIHDADGRVVRAVLVFQDITRLREAEQLKDDFLSLISHEFRTPLTAIHGGAHLLAHQHAALDEETRDDLLGDIVLESERLDRMLANMLSLAAIMAGRLTASTEPVLVGQLVRRAIDEVAKRAPLHAFVVDIPDDLPPLEGDPDLLGQVLRNLYENAVKYAPSGGTIRTSGTTGDSSVTVSIEDQGIGIAPEHVGHVFERFRRPGADPTIRGMGLGLYLSRHLIEAQGGTIRADSPGPDKGAVFSVELPIAAEWHGVAAEDDE